MAMTTLPLRLPSPSSTLIQQSRLLRACHRQAVDTTPVWLMRQAGRYLAEYRRLRERYTILELITTPALACEVTLQPLNAFALDAAIIFADILPPLVGMGLNLAFITGDGPVISNPVRSAADVARLRVTAPEESLWFTLEAITMVRQELASRGLPVIGFSGAPFTLAAYAVAGGVSHQHLEVKRLMLSEPACWEALMTKLSDVVGHYLLAQARAGAQVLQLFDSWVGSLAPQDYRCLVLPYVQRTIAIARQAGVPIIYFGTDTSGLLEAMSQAGSDVIGIDWRIDLDVAWQRLGHDVAIQGNLDPSVLCGPWHALKARAQQVLEQAAGRPGHIFNLGHGILPSTPVDNVARLVDFVHAYEVQWAASA